MSALLETERLALRRWEASDATSAYGIFAAPRVAPWLSPAFPVPGSPEDMRSTLNRWHDEKGRPDAGCVGHWALQTRTQPVLVGGLSLQYAPAGSESLSIAWVLSPDCWGRGYAAEAGEALMRWAMHEHGVREVFAFMPTDNARAVATARRIGMDWVTELGHLTHRNYQVYRLRHADLWYDRSRDRTVNAAADIGPMSTLTGSVQTSSQRTDDPGPAS